MGRAAAESIMYTADAVAARWGCSHQHVHNLIKSGRLRAHRMGQKLIRIPAEAVEEFECQTVISPDSAEAGPQPGTKVASATVMRLVRATRRKPSAS